MPALREASVEQRRRVDFSAGGVRGSAAAEPSLESVRLSVDREGDLSTAPKLAAWQTSPELLYLEVRWVSLIPYGGVARLLEDVLPVTYTRNGMRIRNHLLETAERIETDLGEEKPVFFDGSEQDWEAQPPPDGPMTVGIHGGFVRGVHKEGFFEVIAGKSVVTFGGAMKRQPLAPNASVSSRRSIKSHAGGYGSC